jgi:hypothetical protein
VPCVVDAHRHQVNLQAAAADAEKHGTSADKATAWSAASASGASSSSHNSDPEPDGGSSRHGGSDGGTGGSSVHDGGDASGANSSCDSDNGVVTVLLEQPAEQSPVVCTITSTIRHKRCLYVQGGDTPAFVHGMCYYCTAVPTERDFRERIKRPHAPALESSGANYRSA